MEITMMMGWGLFVTVFSVMAGVVLTRSLANKDDLINEKTLKLMLAPLNLNTRNILEKCESMDNRISHLEGARDDNTGRIQRS